jgi:hypothetical protein
MLLQFIAHDKPPVGKWNESMCQRLPCDGHMSLEEAAQRLSSGGADGAMQAAPDEVSGEGWYPALTCDELLSCRSPYVFCSSSAICKNRNYSLTNL